MTIHLLHEDSHLLALSKSAGQVVIPGRGDLLGEPLLQELERTHGEKLFVVHRLDRGASGLILFARTAKAHRFLSLQFENREVKKSYLVVAEGLLESPGHIDEPLHAFGSGRMGVHPKGKPSVTDYEIRTPLKGATLLDVKPLTGRRHQIRAHLFFIGHPVLGDPLYGKNRPVGGASRLMLHAATLTFRHPSGDILTLQAEPSDDFQEILTSLRAK